VILRASRRVARRERGHGQIDTSASQSHVELRDERARARAGPAVQWTGDRPRRRT